MLKLRGFGTLLILTFLTSAAAQGAKNTKPEPSVLDAVKNSLGDFPEEELVKFVSDEKAKLALLQMLQNPREAIFWPSAVLALGFISNYDPELVHSFVAYLTQPGAFTYGDMPRRPEPRQRANFVSRSEQDAKLNCVLALADQARKENLHAEVYQSSRSLLLTAAPQNPEAIFSVTGEHPEVRYLTNGAKPDFWRGVIQWRSRDFPAADDSELRLALASLAIRGLGIACRQDTYEILLASQSSAAKVPVLADALRTALAACPQPKN